MNNESFPKHSWGKTIYEMKTFLVVLRTYKLHVITYNRNVLKLLRPTQNSTYIKLYIYENLMSQNVYIILFYMRVYYLGYKFLVLKTQLITNFFKNKTFSYIKYILESKKLCIFSNKIYKSCTSISIIYTNIIC